MDFHILESSWLFQGLSADRIKELFQGIPSIIQRYEKDETIFQPLETADRVGVVLKGSVQSYKLFPNGSQVNVTVRQAGDIIGSAAALSVQKKYPSGVVALEHTEILMLSRDDFLRLLKRDPYLVENALFEISTITYMLQQRLELLSYHGIDQKIAFYLLTQSAQSGEAVIPIPGSMTKWALMMNVSRPSLHRELKRLEEQGLLRHTPALIEILDPPALGKLLRR